MHLLLTAIGLVLATATLPLLIELFMLTVASLLPEKKHQQISSGSPPPQLAVVVPAHNEEALIGRCVKSLCNSANGTAPIYVIAHNCSDTTAETAESAGAKVIVYNDQNARGKGYALRLGFEHATSYGADAVLVVDADSTVSANLIPVMREAFSAGADAAQCLYVMQAASSSGKKDLIALALRGFNFIRPLGRRRLGLSSCVYGNGFAVSSSTLSSVPYQAFSITEDLEYHIHLVLAGKRVEFLPAAVVSSVVPESSKAVTTQRSRWEGGRFRIARAWLPRLGREILHGRFHVIEPMLDLSGLPIALGVALLLFVVCLPLHWAHMYGIAGLSVVLLHVLAAVWSGPRRLQTLGSLLLSPFYLLWKLCLLPNILRSSSADTQWVRTDREPAVRSSL